MKLPRKISEEERNDLKAVTRHTLDIARPTKFELVTRVKAPALTNYGSASEPDSFMPIDIAVEICRDTGLPMIIEEMARLCGFRLVPLDPEEAGAIDIDDVTDAHKETSEAVTAIAQLARGTGSARAVIKEIDESVVSLLRVRRKAVA
jgi:hypothetical protein